MDRRGPAWAFGGIFAFVGLTGRRDDFLATVQHIDMLGLPPWLDWSLIVIGIVLISYAVFWSMHEASETASDHDQEWTEDGALKRLEMQQAHSRQLATMYIQGLVIIVVVGAVSISLATCEQPFRNPSVTLYRECLKHAESAESCQDVLEIQSQEGQP